MNDEIKALLTLGRGQTNRLTRDIVWNSLYISDYENRYGIDPHVVSDFADGYISWLCAEFEDEIDRNDINTIFKVLDREVRHNSGGCSFYDYTHFIYCAE